MRLSLPFFPTVPWRTPPLTDIAPLPSSHRFFQPLACPDPRYLISFTHPAHSIQNSRYGVVGERVTNAILGKTFFAHFCAGETAEQVMFSTTTAVRPFNHAAACLLEGVAVDVKSKICPPDTHHKDQETN